MGRNGEAKVLKTPPSISSRAWVTLNQCEAKSDLSAVEGNAEQSTVITAWRTKHRSIPAKRKEKHAEVAISTPVHTPEAPENRKKKQISEDLLPL